MHIATAFSAAALLSGTALAIPNDLEQREADPKWYNAKHRPYGPINAAVSDGVLSSSTAASTIIPSGSGPAAFSDELNHPHRHISLTDMPSSTYDSCPTDTTTSTITLIANTTSISYFTSFADITAVPSSSSWSSSRAEASSSIVELESSYWVPDSTSSSTFIERSTTARNPPHVHTHTHQQNPNQNPGRTHTRYQNPQPTPSYIESSYTMSGPGVPVTIATGTCLHPETSIEQTATVSGTPHSGTANPKAYHCGLHGLPIGDYFLARFVQDENAAPMTVLTCYKYCTGVYGANMGCESYEFYPEPETDAPRCDLFGGSVAQSLASINQWVPNIWYDLGCGVPPAQSGSGMLNLNVGNGLQIGKE